MNILVPDLWLREHLKTKATSSQIADDLSLCSQSVEKMNQVDDDVIYEIEITTNRPDCLSVYGIARELSAILPRFGILAKLRPLPITNHQSPITKNGLSLEVKITNPSFCPRFTALIFDNIKIKPSPKVVQERLEKSGIRALNNVVDISNYLMLELGQPMHTFDYDKIFGAKMILREAKEGEQLQTLDGQTRKLPPGTIIIEDGKGRIIDLCGIMGGENSAVDEKTKRVLLFIQTYDPARIRRTCQQMAFRTEAAARFEKSVDPEGVMLAMKKAVVMFKENCEAHVASNLIDIYPNPPGKKTVSLSQSKLNLVLGIEIKLTEAKKILESLGFQSSIINHQSSIIATVPHWRNSDVSIPEDLVEEIARIYGYHNLPGLLTSGQIPPSSTDNFFLWEKRIKNSLQYWGFTETYNYSLISEENLKKAGIDSRNLLRVANPLSEEWVYLRPSLLPSLLGVVTKNQDEFEKIQIFEIANIYLPHGQNLPWEIPILAGVMSQSDFSQAKGIVEALLEEIGLVINFKPYQETGDFEDQIFSSPSVSIFLKNSLIGQIGQIHPGIGANFNLKQKVLAFNLDLCEIAKNATTLKKYQPIPKYPAIIEDLSFVVPVGTQVGNIIQSIKEVSSIIKSVDLLDSYQDTRTFRITYQSRNKTLSGEEVNNVRKRITGEIQKKLGATLKN